MTNDAGNFFLLGFWQESLIAATFALIGLLGVRKMIIKTIWRQEV